MLDLANQELESFSYSVSHDLRAPLRGIEGFSQALFEDYHDRLDATGQDYLRRVSRSCQRMNALIDVLLTLSRATSAELHLRNCDLGALGAEIIAELRSTEPERSLTFTAAPDLQVHGDPELLRIALDNLLSNAWKFTRRNAAASIELGMTQEQGRVVYFVRDNGVGFDMQYAGRLFVPFQRLHHLDDFEGTGIGLASVQPSSAATAVRCVRRGRPVPAPRFTSHSARKTPASVAANTAKFPASPPNVDQSKSCQCQICGVHVAVLHS